MLISKFNFLNVISTECLSSDGCAGATDTCNDGVCKCDAADPCSGTSDTCDSGTCKCGTADACSGDSDTCTNGVCKCDAADACAAPLSNICDGAQCKCGANTACVSGSTLDTCLKSTGAEAATSADNDAKCGVSFIIMFCIQ